MITPIILYPPLIYFAGWWSVPFILLNEVISLMVSVALRKL